MNEDEGVCLCLEQPGLTRPASFVRLMEGDMAVVNAIVQGNALNGVAIEGDASALLEKYAAKINAWNKALR